uniref:Uncharacterized protein n=1 Tax=Anguilla anguilla TaxID=7936 RepID=A0A0E9W7Q0_ANGAN
MENVLGFEHAISLQIVYSYLLLILLNTYSF